MPRNMEDLELELKSLEDKGWGELCRKMQILVLRQRRDLACKLLTQFDARHHHDAVTLDDHVAMLLPVKIANALERNGYATFRAVKNAKAVDLLGISNFGETTLRMLRDVVARIERGELIDIPDEPIEQICERTKG
jgi:DNA-directed RNA polymerase alpha subunit